MMMWSSILLGLCALSCAICLVLTWQGQAQMIHEAQQGQLWKNRPVQDADGCYHVFIDVGANIGVHGRFLLEPEKYQKAKAALTIFDREFGANRNNKDICTFEIEPNPAHVSAHVRNAAAYQAMGWRYHFMPFAASDQDNTTMEFYHQGRDLARNVSEWGFTSSPNRKSGKVEHIPSLRLSKWLQDHVIDRIIPEVPHGEQAHQIGPKVVMKMDIEGGEWTVLPDLITTGALCSSVDFLFGEFHNFFNKDKWNQFYKPLQIGMHKVLEASSTNCKTQFKELDDEAYLLDGMPLPEPSS